MLKIKIQIQISSCAIIFLLFFNKIFLKQIYVYNIFFKIYNITMDPDPNSMYLSPQHWSYENGDWKVINFVKISQLLISLDYCI